MAPSSPRWNLSKNDRCNFGVPCFKGNPSLWLSTRSSPLSRKAMPNNLGRHCRGEQNLPACLFPRMTTWSITGYLPWPGKWESDELSTLSHWIWGSVYYSSCCNKLSSHGFFEVLRELKIIKVWLDWQKLWWLCWSHELLGVWKILGPSSVLPYLRFDALPNSNNLSNLQVSKSQDPIFFQVITSFASLRFAESTKKQVFIFYVWVDHASFGRGEY